MKKYLIRIPIISSLILWVFISIFEKYLFRKDLSLLKMMFYPPLENLYIRIFTIGIIFISYFIVKNIIQMSKIQKNILKQKLELAMNSTSEGIFEINFKDNSVFLDSNFYTILGYENREFNPDFKHLIDLIHQDDVKIIYDLLKILNVDINNIFEIEIRFKSKDDKYIWTYCKGKVTQRDENNKIIKLLGTIEDISRRKKIELKLKTSEQKIRIVFENISDGIIVFDKDLRVELINKSAENIIHFTEEEAVGKHVDEIFPIENFTYKNKTMRNILFDVLTTKKSTTIDNAVYKCFGGRTLCSHNNYEDIYIEDGISLIQDEFGKISGVVIVFRDITEKIKVNKINKNLQDELQHSSKMEAIDQFSGGIAHDFNNIITAINGFTEISLDKIEESNPIYDNLKEIKISCDRAKKLTSKLQAFNRRQVINLEILDINEHLLNFKNVSKRIVDEDIEITYSLNSTYKIMADKSQIDQILFNIIGNARDALNSNKYKNSSKNIYIRTSDVVVGDELFNHHNLSIKNGDYVLIEIEDNGPGIKDEIKDKIFDPFFTTKEEGKGTGMGMSITYGIIKQHNGGIFLESEIGKGTIFKIYFPKTLDIISKKNNNKIINVQNKNNNAKILLVEDENSVRKLLMNFLNKLGYKIEVCKNGKEALEKWNNTFDLIITDIKMPQMGGHELIKKIKTITPNVKVIYISGYNPHKDLLEKNFISKPFSLKVLSDKIRMILNEEKQ